MKNNITVLAYTECACYTSAGSNKSSAAIWTLSANDVLDDDIVSVTVHVCASCDPVDTI